MCINTWRSGNWEDRAKISSVLSSDRTRGNRHKVKYRKAHSNIRRNFFTVRVVECWNILPREAVESPILEILRSQ